MNKVNFWEDNEDDYQEKLMTEWDKSGIFEKHKRRARIVSNVAKVLITICVILCIISFVIGIVR